MAATIPETEGKRGCCSNSCSDSSSVKINSIYIDLDSADKTEEKASEKFSIRGYVAKVQNKAGKNCWPFAWNNHKTDETVPVFESELTPSSTNHINVRNEDSGDPDLFNMLLISATACMNSSLNNDLLLGDALTFSHDLHKMETLIPTPKKTPNEELKSLVECDNDMGVDKSPITCPREDDEEEEIVIRRVNNDYDSSKDKGKHPSMNRSSSLLVEGTHDDVVPVDTNQVYVKKSRKRRTRLLSELLDSEMGNHVTAFTRPKTQMGGNLRKKLLNDEEWRPYKTNTKNISNKKKISKRKKSYYTNPDNFHHNISKSCNGIPDDVAMEIAEPMAENQCERRSKNTIEISTAIENDNYIKSKIPCNNHFNLWEEGATITTTCPPSSPPLDWKKKRWRWNTNTGVHLKSKNGCTSGDDLSSSTTKGINHNLHDFQRIGLDIRYNNNKDYYDNSEPCNVNRNPSDFSAPSGRNTYMIGNDDLVFGTKKERRS